MQCSVLLWWSSVCQSELKTRTSWIWALDTSKKNLALENVTRQCLVTAFLKKKYIANRFWMKNDWRWKIRKHFHLINEFELFCSSNSEEMKNSAFKGLLLPQRREGSFALPLPPSHQSGWACWLPCSALFTLSLQTRCHMFPLPPRQPSCLTKPTSFLTTTPKQTTVASTGSPSAW